MSGPIASLSASANAPAECMYVPDDDDAKSVVSEMSAYSNVSEPTLKSSRKRKADNDKNQMTIQNTYSPYFNFMYKHLIKKTDTIRGEATHTQIGEEKEGGGFKGAYHIF